MSETPDEPRREEGDVDDPDVEYQYLRGPSYWISAITPSTPSGWAALGGSLVIIAVMVISILNMYTKENPEHTSTHPSNFSAPASSQDIDSGEKRRDASTESLYGYDAPWAAQTREIALAFGSDNWEERLRESVPRQIVDDISQSDWPRGTQPIIDTVNDVDGNLATKVEFLEGWNLYIIVDIDHDTDDWSISRLEYGIE